MDSSTQASLSITNSWSFSNSGPLSRWGHPTISSSVVPFSSRPQLFPVSGSFPRSQFFASGGQSIGVSASASVLPMNIQDLFPLGWTGWISLQSKGLSRVFSKCYFFGCLVVKNPQGWSLLPQKFCIPNKLMPLPGPLRKLLWDQLYSQKAPAGGTGRRSPYALQPSPQDMRNPKENAATPRTHSPGLISASQQLSGVFPLRQDPPSLLSPFRVLPFIWFINYSSCVAFYLEPFSTPSEILAPKAALRTKLIIKAY